MFHLMRVVEHGLRAFCVHFGIKRVRKENKKNKKVTYTSLDWEQWDTLLGQMRARVGVRLAAAKRGAKKQTYQEFYLPVFQDIEGIKDAFRNHVMHARRQYSPEDAEAILSHVKRLMNMLSARVKPIPVDDVQ